MSDLKNGKKLEIEDLVAPDLVEIPGLAEKEIVLWKNLKPTDPIVLSPADFDRLVDEINNPRPPTPALIKARERYVEMKRQQIQDEMDEHMVKTSSAKRL